MPHCLFKQGVRRIPLARKQESAANLATLLIRVVFVGKRKIATQEWFKNKAGWKWSIGWHENALCAGVLKFALAQRFASRSLTFFGAQTTHMYLDFR